MKLLNMKSKLLLFVVLFSSQINAQVKKAPGQVASEKTVQTNEKKSSDLSAQKEAEINTINADAERKQKAVQDNSNLSEVEKKSELDKINTEKDAAIVKIQKETSTENSEMESQKANINTSRSNIKQEN